MENSIIKIIKAGIDFLNGPLIFACISKDPHIIKDKVNIDIISNSFIQILIKIIVEQIILTVPII